MKMHVYKTHRSRFVGRHLYTWCGRGVSKPLPPHLLVVSDKRRVTCKMCLLAYENNRSKR